MTAPFFFQSEPFITHQGNYRIESNESCALAWFEKDNKAFSPLKAPFGSFFPNNEKTTTGPILELINQLENHCNDLNLESITITHCPEIYQPEFSHVVRQSLQTAGFSILFEDVNFHLPINNAFKLNLHRSERWKLNKARREGYRFRKINPPLWDLVFPILEQSRLRKGYPLSMDRLELEKVFKTFPDRYKTYGIFLKDQCVAVAITVEISAEIEYIFYTADEFEHRKRSPVVLLHEGIYNECINSNRKILDLGTSSLKGVLNPGVATFKKNLGGITSMKTSYFKRLKPEKPELK